MSAFGSMTISTFIFLVVRVLYFNKTFNSKPLEKSSGDVEDAEYFGSVTAGLINNGKDFMGLDAKTEPS